MKKSILIFVVSGAVLNAVLVIVNIFIGRHDLVPINLAMLAVSVTCLTIMS
jgi:hypothetical protein